MTALRILPPHDDPIVTMAKEIVRTDADRTKLLGALLHGDLGGSEDWAEAIFPVEQAFRDAYREIDGAADQFPTIRRYHTDPAFNAQIKAERQGLFDSFYAESSAAIDRANPRKHWENEA